MTDDIYLRVRRSPGRTLVTLLVGVLLLFATYDIVAGYWMSGPPETDEETGAITSQGMADRRNDYIWGALLGTTGVLLTLGALITLVVRPVIVSVYEDRLRIRIGGPTRLVDIPWEDVRWIHSGNGLEDSDVPTRLLLVHVEHPDRYPSEPWGSEWDGSTLMVDAGSWDLNPEEVVSHAWLALDAFRRRQALDPDALDQDAPDQRAVDQDAVDEGAVDQDVVDQDVVAEDDRAPVVAAAPAGAVDDEDDRAAAADPDGEV